MLQIDSPTIQRTETLISEAVKNRVYRSLMRRFYVSEEDIKAKMIRYDGCVTSYDNSVYDGVLIRFVQLAHLSDRDSWHYKQEKYLQKLLKNFSDKSLIDIGYGVPRPYHLQFLLKSTNRLVLGEKNHAANKFAEEFFRLKNHKLKNQISYRVLDINTTSRFGKHDIFLLLDVIEHSASPKEFFENIFRQAKTGSTFVISLPVGPLVPVHSISWQSEESLVKWVSSFGLNVIEQKAFHPQKNDHWAEPIDGDFYEVLVVAEKL